MFVSQPSLALPLQLRNPGLHRKPSHTPCRHVAVAFGGFGQTFPQAPQLLGSFVLRLQVESSGWKQKPASQVHSPRKQWKWAPHWMPQPPQLCLSDSRFLHRLPHRVSPEGQFRGAAARAELPPALSVFPEEPSPELPVLSGSVVPAALATSGSTEASATATRLPPTRRNIARRDMPLANVRERSSSHCSPATETSLCPTSAAAIRQLQRGERAPVAAAFVENWLFDGLDTGQVGTCVQRTCISPYVK